MRNTRLVALRHLSQEARASQIFFRVKYLGQVTRHYSTDDQNNKTTLRDQINSEPRSFQAQLWDSSYQRIKRDREQKVKYGAMQNFGQSATNRTIAILGLTFFSIGIGYWVGRLQSPSPPSTSSTLSASDAAPVEHETRSFVLQAAWAEFVDLLGESNVSTTVSELESHAGSSWSTHATLPEDIPFAVLRPESTEQVSEIMKICHARRIAVTPYSGGTSLEGHFAATHSGVCLDFSRMSKILQLHAADLDVVVQPGLGWEDLNEELAQAGLFFPPDPGPGAQIGGMIGTGCSGTNAYRYGTMKDWVLGLTIVLADGTVVHTRRRPRKSSAGYDLTRLFIGSEGTLGIVTEATLKITPRPEIESVAVCSFATIRDAAETASRVVRSGIPVAAVEIMDDVQMRCINDAGMTEKKWKEAPTLFFKFASTAIAVKEHIALTKTIAQDCGCKTFEFAKKGSQAVELWSARKEALWSVVAQSTKDSHRVWTTDVAVPISSLPQIIEETQQHIRESGLLGSILGHVGDGNFHAIILYDSQSTAERAAAQSVVSRMVDRAIELEGTATGEHGIGLVKRKHLVKEVGAETVALMRKLKLAVDPLCLLNCDKIVQISDTV